MIATPQSPTQLRLISTTDYHRMAEVGILGADEQVELLAGQIIQKMPKGPAHSALCKRIEKLLERRLGEQVLVRLQAPIRLDNYSEPEPDIAVVRPQDDFYASHHPTSADFHLIIEVADTTVERDLSSKAALYSTAGILDYWVLNVSARQLHVFRDPSPDGYQRQLILREQAIQLQAFPACEISVLECFGGV
ncbi:MAG: Uma2 family endonuclease [Cyanobacteria bacterium P01_F01_bin.56]